MTNFYGLSHPVGGTLLWQPNKLIHWSLSDSTLCVCLVAQLCPAFCERYSMPGSSVHGILQARILEWVAMPSSRGSSLPRDQTQVSRTAGGFFTDWATGEAEEYWVGSLSLLQGSTPWDAALITVAQLQAQKPNTGYPIPQNTAAKQYSLCSLSGEVNWIATLWASRAFLFYASVWVIIINLFQNM